MKVIRKILHNIDLFYWKRGIIFPEIRDILLWQTVVVFIGCIIDVGIFMYSNRVAWFTFGATVWLWNFYALVQLSIRFFEQGRMNIFSFFINTNIRLLIVSFLGYIALVKLHAPSAALLVGLSSLPGCIVCTSIRSVLLKKNKSI